MRILLVEDDGILGASLKKALEQQSYGVDWLQDGESALAALQQLDFEAAILDVNLPKLNGLEVIKAVRRQKIFIPILLLTAMDTSQHKVEGLDSGADDYLVKPFDLDELLARLRALLRRGKGHMQTVLMCGDVEIDLAAKVVRKANAPVILTAKELRVLKILMERANKYVTKSDIEYVLYDAENAVESNTTEVAVYSLRKKLGSDFIKSIRGVGYMVEK